MSQFSPLKLNAVLDGIRSCADQDDETAQWPEADLCALAEVGAMRWAVPTEFGGDEVSPLELHLRYQTIASASMTTALILTQRDSAVQIISAAKSWTRRQQALKKLAANEVFATVGIAQLTTSRQRGALALAAKQVDGGYVLNGEIPWATGANQSDFVIAGAVMEDRRQILFALPTDLPGVVVPEPLPLVALRSSHTTTVRCEDVRLNDEQILNGPVEQALSLRNRGVPIGQAFLALGLCSGALKLIGGIESDAGKSTLDRLTPRLAQLATDVARYCESPEPDGAVGNELRGRCIEMALRTTHAAVSLYKGTGLLAGHPAQRLAREAMFLLVWSCPSPVQECTLELLTQQGQRAEG